MKHRLLQMIGRKTKLYMLRKHGRQFSGFAARLAKDPITGELSCSLRWPGGQLFIGFAHMVPGLISG